MLPSRIDDSNEAHAGKCLLAFDPGATEAASVEPLLSLLPRHRSLTVRAEDERLYFYTAREIAHFLHVMETTIYRPAKRGELPPFATGCSIVICVQDVEAFVGRARNTQSDQIVPKATMPKGMMSRRTLCALNTRRILYDRKTHHEFLLISAETATYIPYSPFSGASDQH